MSRPVKGDPKIDAKYRRAFAALNELGEITKRGGMVVDNLDRDMCVDGLTACSWAIPFLANRVRIRAQQGMKRRTKRGKK
jgi:hypothetical protein